VIGAQSAGYRALPWLQSQGQLGPARLRELVFVNDMQSWPTNVRICLIRALRAHLAESRRRRVL
jgi:hypothetical protein